VQVIIIPVGVISILHIPIVMLHWQRIMPFIVQHIEHMPVFIIVIMFCIMAHWVLSLHEQLHVMPPGISSIFMLQRGIIIAGIMPGAMKGVVIWPDIEARPISDMRLVVIGFMLVPSPRVAGQSTKKLENTHRVFDGFSYSPFRGIATSPYGTMSNGMCEFLELRY
jgi:hypothetical protein